MTKKIVYLSDSTVPSRTANSVHVMKMCQAFSDNGHDVELLAPDRDSRSTDAVDAFSIYSVRPVFKLTRIRRSKQIWGGLQYAYGASRHAKHARPDLVYGRAVLACFQAAKHGLPVILEVHDLKFLERGLHYRISFAMLLRQETFRYLVVISQALAADIVALYPSLEGRIRIAHDGADPVADLPEQKPLVGRSTALQVGYVGNIYPGRGLELLEAIARRLPWLDLHIVGNWDRTLNTHDGGKALPSNVHVHGFLPYVDAERMRMACDLLLAPYQRAVYTPGGSDISRWMSPLKIFEYMAAGKAIICSEIPVLREILTHKETVWFCPTDDIDAWCAALTELRDDERLRLRLGNAARAKLLRFHTWRSRAAEVLHAPEPGSA